jgi:hypothetical protein
MDRFIVVVLSRSSTSIQHRKSRQCQDLMVHHLYVPKRLCISRIILAYRMQRQEPLNIQGARHVTVFYENVSPGHLAPRLQKYAPIYDGLPWHVACSLSQRVKLQYSTTVTWNNSTPASMVSIQVTRHMDLTSLSTMTTRTRTQPKHFGWTRNSNTPFTDLRTSVYNVTLPFTMTIPYLSSTASPPP